MLECRALLSASATFNVIGDWGGEFQGEIAIVNGSTALSSWQLEFDFSKSITEIWDARIQSHVGNHYVIRNQTWNGALAAGQAVAFGFLGTSGNVTSGPTNYVFNGQPLTSTGGLPTLSILDASVAEPNQGSAVATFSVTLSAASTSPVTVSYATSNGTATAGSDYVAASGLLTFAPGVTSRPISVTILGDLLDEAQETFNVTLSGPSGATLADGAAVGTILDNDPAPAISIGDAIAFEPLPGTGTGSGFLHTSGNQILNAANQPVRIAGVSWFGLETDTFSPHGLWTRNWKSMMDQIAAEGFNTIRLPYSNQLFDAGSTPNGIDFYQNPDLVGLNGLGIIDKIVDYAGQIGLRIMLDHHRSNAGASANENGLWYTTAYPESRWIADWTMLAQRYAGNATVIGADVHNEPHGPANWGQGGANDWRLAAERVGNAILAVNPDWLIVVEGVQDASSGSYWWGGNLSNAGASPVRLSLPGRLVYSPHSYPASVWPQSWFSDPNYPDNLPQVWDRNWGYLFREGTAPVLLGEFGSKLNTTSDQLWLDKMVDYLAGDLDGDGDIDLSAGQLGMSWTYWSWNPNSSDTGGILQDNWNTVHQNKLDALEPIQFELPEVTSGGTANAIVTVSLAVPSGQTVTVAYATANGTASSGSDYLTTTGTVTFAPGQTQKTISVPIVGDGVAEPTKTLRVVLSSPSQATLANTFGTISILDSEGLAGDANGDGMVDGADYTVWANNFLQASNLGRFRGDFNRDGLVDGADYTLWANAYTPSAAAPLAAALPSFGSGSQTGHAEFSVDSNSALPERIMNRAQRSAAESSAPPAARWNRWDEAVGHLLPEHSLAAQRYAAAVDALLDGINLSEVEALAERAHRATRRR